MKILFVCQYFYPEQFKINEICFELARKGNDVTVLTGLPNYPNGIVDKKYRKIKTQYEDINGVKVIRTFLIGRGKRKITLALNYLSFAISSSIKALFMKKEFDLILVYQLSPITMAIPGIILKHKLKIPLVMYSFDLWPESIVSGGINNKGITYKLLLKLSQYIYKKADLILTSSKMFEEYFRNVIEYKNNIINLPVFAEDLFKKTLKEEKKDFVDLFFAGNIGEMQSLETIVFCANELKNNTQIRFHIVGDGSSKIKCEMLSDELRLNNIKFYGSYPIEEMPKFYSFADAFLITLKANETISYTLPNKMQSYLASGKPVIGAINGETRLVIEESNCGLVSNAEDYIQLAKNIEYFASNREKWIEYSFNAINYYEKNYKKEVFFDKLENILKYI